MHCYYSVLVWLPITLLTKLTSYHQTKKTIKKKSFLRLLSPGPAGRIEIDSTFRNICGSKFIVSVAQSSTVLSSVFHGHSFEGCWYNPNTPVRATAMLRLPFCSAHLHVCKRAPMGKKISILVVKPWWRSNVQNGINARKRSGMTEYASLIFRNFRVFSRILHVQL